MKTFYVHTNMGYCGTDHVLEIEAETEAEAHEYAYQECVGMIDIHVCESQEEAEEAGGY